MSKGFNPLKPCQSWKDVALAIYGRLKYTNARIAYAAKYLVYLSLKFGYALKMHSQSLRFGNVLVSYLLFFIQDKPDLPAVVAVPRLKSWPNIVVDSFTQLNNSCFWIVNRALRPVFAAASSWKISLYISFAFGASLSIPYVGAVSTGYILGFLSVLCVLSGYAEYQKVKTEEILESNIQIQAKAIEDLKALVTTLSERVKNISPDNTKSEEKHTLSPTLTFSCQLAKGFKPFTEGFQIRRRHSLP